METVATIEQLFLHMENFFNAMGLGFTLGAIADVCKNEYPNLINYPLYVENLDIPEKIKTAFLSAWDKGYTLEGKTKTCHEVIEHFSIEENILTLYE